MLGLELSSNIRLSLVRRSPRVLKENEVLVRVLTCGICGTDNHIIKGESRAAPPVILGHEFGGVIKEIGEEVTTLNVGDLVAVDPNIPCYTCEYCREGNIHLCKKLTAIGVDTDGGMSDSCIVPVRQAYKLPPSFDPQALPFVEPLSCVLHGLDRLNVRQGEKVLVIGAGTIGLMHLVLLKGIAGELFVDEMNPERLAKAVSFEAKREDRKLVEYFDAVLECSGSIAGFEKAITNVKRGGRILVFGVAPIEARAHVSPNAIYSKEITILGSYVNPYTFRRAIETIVSGKIPISGFDVKLFSLQEYEHAFAASRSGEFSKVAFGLAEGI